MENDAPMMTSADKIFMTDMFRLPGMLLIVFFFTFTSCHRPSGEWQPASCPLPTRWTPLVDPGNPSPEYPRPQMVRADWINLNGLWDYTILKKDDETPVKFAGKILVPFPLESSLSGVGEKSGPDRRLWYRREFTLPPEWTGKRILLHFEAVDWETSVWVNATEVGRHLGGYDPFYFDITDALTTNTQQTLTVAVWDPTNDGWQPRGKQVTNPGGGIFYTSTTGIWQTVWMEPVEETYIEDIRLVPDIDSRQLQITTLSCCPQPDDSLAINIFFKDDLVSHVNAIPNEPVLILVDSCHLWSPESPVLYDLDISLFRRGELLDEVTSYAGMRKISLGKDEKGITRIMLNNAFVFQNGPLDQGFWPDGIYTPPTDEAMRYDIETIRKMGFNALRKHVKVEPRRFYYWCDHLGVLVYQDMPSGFKDVPDQKEDTIQSDETKMQFKEELQRMIESHYNHPCIVMWVPFNEGWGQFNTDEIVRMIKNLDPSRLVDDASGWTDQYVGDVIDIHHYPEPESPRPEKYRAAVLGEFGGLGYRVKDHTWQEDNWGYKTVASTDSLLTIYREYYGLIAGYKIDPGLSASIYTQLTDVETECNGLMTYDRNIIKMDLRALSDVNRSILITAQP